ncbi:MAG: protein translocase subunit SecD, partial [Francisellaceae bacterium]|nr:protein translocase subunit SecD [Francisellaceae bacterium]
FNSEDELAIAKTKLKSVYPELEFKKPRKEDLLLIAQLSQTLITEIRNYTMEQTTSTLRNRVNELGVAEAIVQRQGLNRVVVELPGIQDTARAKDILGKTATLDFVLKDMENDPYQALNGRGTPPGSKLLYHKEGYPILVKKKIILTGDSIVGASSALDSQEGKPVVQIKLGGKGLGAFKSTTKRNVNKFMAVIYREVKFQDKVIDGKIISEPVTTETVISDARILQPLGANFNITGLGMHEARELALLLRSGALPATVSIVEERIVGPSLGQENIEMGMISLAVGLSLVLIFMALYYSVFGWIANIALVFNLVLLVALMSIIGATLTLPGLAGIVLTLGMAVDANVLIFERIREELRIGVTPIASIHRGFDHAFSTIIDANLTTLIVGVILFAVGTGPVKGFAITLSMGILTSMFTAITGTRAMVEYIYGGNKEVKKLAVGI